MRAPLFLSALPFLMALGCAAGPLDTDGAGGGSAGDEDVGQAEDPILGTTSFTHCSVDQQRLLLESARFMRVGANSAAFAQCVSQGMQSGISVNTASIGPYYYCNGDPYPSDAMTQRISRVLGAVAAGTNNLVIDCSTTSWDGNAQTWQNDGLYHTNDETLQFNGPWIADIASSLSHPTCTGTNDPPGCRYAAYPWPYPQLGAITLHEASHTHGYGHGDNSDNAAAATACGTTSIPGWYFRQNTVPYLIASCLSEVMMESAQASRCGAQLSSSACRGDQLYLETAPGATTCTCVDDPRLVRIRTAPVAQVYAGRAGTFATDQATGNVYRYNGSPDNWTQIGGPGATFVVNDVGLYGLTPSRQAVMAWNGTSWAQIGGPATTLYAGGSRLYAIDPATGNILRYNGSANSWTVVGGPGAMFAVTADGTLYGLTPSKGAVMRYQDSWPGAGTWSQVGGPAGRIVGGGRTLPATSTDEWSLYQFDGTNWSYVGGTAPSSTVVANDTTVYSGDTIGGSVYRYNGTPDVWDRVANRPSGFWAGAHSMYVARAGSGAGLYQMVSP